MPKLNHLNHNKSRVKNNSINNTIGVMKILTKTSVLQSKEIKITYVKFISSNQNIINTVNTFFGYV